MKDIADTVGVSPQAISQYEHNHQTPSPDVMRRLARTLEFPTHFFLRPKAEALRGVTYYRSLESTKKSDRAKADRHFEWLLEIVKFLCGFVHFSPVNFPDLGGEDPSKISNMDIEAAAIETRRFWKLGDGPISNVAWLVENHGGVVARQRLDSNSIDAFSEWNPSDETPYVVLGTDKESAVRSRFDLGHELAHLVLHSKVPKELFNQPSIHGLMERQANRFSSAILLPEASFSGDLYSLTLDGLLAIKEKWKVSVGAMVVRSQQLGLISEERSRRLHINRMRRGWRTWEPLDDELLPEEPQYLRQAFDVIFENQLASPQTLELQLGLTASDIENSAGLPSGYLSVEPDMPSLKMFPEQEPNTPLINKTSRDTAS